MSGNRNRQRAMQIPFLFELAANGGEIDISLQSRQRSEDLAFNLACVLHSYFYFTSEEKEERHAKSGHLVLENDVLRAVDQLHDQKEITRIHRTSWIITEAGLRRLRDYLSTLARKKSLASEMEELAVSLVRGQTDLFVFAMQYVVKAPEAESIEKVLSSARSILDIFQNSIAEMPLSQMCDFVTETHEHFHGVVLTDLAAKHHLTPKRL